MNFHFLIDDNKWLLWRFLTRICTCKFNKLRFLLQCVYLLGVFNYFGKFNHFIFIQKRLFYNMKFQPLHLELLCICLCLCFSWLLESQLGLYFLIYRRRLGLYFLIYRRLNFCAKSQSRNSLLEAKFLIRSQKFFHIV